MATTTKYAEGTGVSISKSREEIEKTLKRYGATGFMYGEETTGEKTTAAVGFQMKGRHYRLLLPYPPVEKMRYTRTRVRRTDAQMATAHDSELRRLWRSLTMIVKAKLEAVEAQITTIEREFLADTVLANNQTFYEWAEPQINEVYQSGEMPAFLPGISPISRRLEIKGARPSDEDTIDGEIIP